MALTVAFSSTKPSQFKAEVVVVPVVAGRVVSGSLSTAVQRKIAQHARKVGFKGVLGSAEVLVWRGAGLQALFVGLVGLGDAHEDAYRRAEALRRGVAKVVQDSRAHGVQHIAVSLFGITEVFSGEDSDQQLAVLGAAAVEGAELANYRYTEYSERLQQEERVHAVRRLTLLGDQRFSRVLRSAIGTVRRVLPGVFLTRDLVNRPPGDMRPRTLVEQAREIARSSSRLSVTVWDRTWAAQKGFSAFLSVARGSAEEPYVIHLTWKPDKPARKKIFVVGKGITFDSGGLSLKPVGFMESMKMDMAGAASVLGLFSVLPALELPLEVHGVIAACENMPSGTAYRPGDVVRAKNGKTIEILNTDAEGRVTLADALSFAAEHQPDAIIDLATLTGACMVALGETHAGLWSNNDELAASLLTSSQVTGEGMTRLPLPDEYQSYIKSAVADVRNVRGPRERVGDAIAAALFLREFVADVPWAHLDIAGPAYMESSLLPYYSLGATGYGVRTLAEYLREASLS